MGKRGVKPQPTVLKLLKGNPGKRPLNQLEPQPARDAILPPAYLVGPSLDKWNEVLPGLLATGVVTNADVETLARYCTMYEQFLFCLAEIRAGRDQIELKHPETGELLNIKSTPSGLNSHKLAASMLRIEQEFGLTPSARSGIVAKKIDKVEDGIDPRIFG
jgi:P27 family predicted phage terminase small subunit